jgi:hypothetical protein
MKQPMKGVLDGATLDLGDYNQYVRGSHRFGLLLFVNLMEAVLKRYC